MKDGQPQEIRLADYQAPDYQTVETHLEFDIEDGATLVTSRLKVVRRRDAADTLELDGEDLELISVQVDDRVLSGNEYQLSAGALHIHGLSDEHEVRIVTRVKPEENTALEGLYRSGQMYCTQCEAQGFRKITYYQDRPDVSSVFTTTVTADAKRYPTLLSNGNLLRERVENGRRTVTWHDPFPKPSYLFALVAGDLAVIRDQFTTHSGRAVELRIYSEPHNIGQCDYAMDVLKRSMRWDEQRFGREYDLDVFMIVAVEDFNMGAMENKGLNIFNTSCVLASADTATDAAYQRVEAVVAHEYFHNWSGNRVTCRDWFQLSLKEGFTVFRDAEFSSDMNSRAVKRIEDVTFLRAVQFAEDAGPLAHPVRPQSYIEISNFYTTTIYEKGAEVVRMYHTLLGEEAFRRGSDLYFARHDGAAATTDDFTAAMEEAGAVDLSQFKRWYDQAGTPLLTVGETFSDGALQLTISQSCPPTPGQPQKLPFHVPLLLGLVGADGRGLAVEELDIECSQAYEVRGDSLLVHLREADCQLRVSGLQAKPVVSFLRGFSAPVKVAYPRPDTELAFLAQHDNDGFVRWDALQTLWVKHLAGTPAEGVDLQQVVQAVAAAVQPQNQSAEALTLAATMLSVPEENYLFEQLATFEVDSLIDAREKLLDQLAAAAEAEWQRIYEQSRQPGGYQPDAPGMAARAVGNTAFAYLARAARGEALQQLVAGHYQQADNLTERRAALQQACRHPGLEPEFARWLIGDFYQRWQEQALVLDMWFSLQAQSAATDIDGMRALEAHPRFDLRNPNRVRAVFGAFGMYNHRRLHALDGSGYQYLADAVARLDASNPQVAARITTPLTRWQRYDPPRQKLMRDALQHLAERKSISKDLYEIVSKSLNA